MLSLSATGTGMMPVPAADSLTMMACRYYLLVPVADSLVAAGVLLIIEELCPAYRK